MGHKGILWLIVSFAVVAAVASGEAHCMSTYTEFEEKVIVNRPQNQENLFQAFYQPNRPFPLSVRIVYHVNTSNGTDQILSTDLDCPHEQEIWMWIPSSIYLFVEPTKLNVLALYTLNYFKSWTPPTAHILIPQTACQHNQISSKFLTEMTMMVGPQWSNM